MASHKHLLFVCLLAFAICVPVLANAKPIIDSATPNYATNQLTIVGSGFGSLTPTVAIDGKGATVISHTPTQIVVSFPSGIGTGSYLVTVTASGATGSFDLTLGTAGPQGPPGPQGVPGSQGQQGPPGVSVGYHGFAFNTLQIGTSQLLFAQAPALSTTGYYYVTGMAQLQVAGGDLVGCEIASQNSGNFASPAITNIAGYQTVSVAGQGQLGAGDVLYMFCVSYATGNSYFYNGGFTAVLVNTDNNVTLLPEAKGQAKKQLRPSTPGALDNGSDRTR
jgi:IPT/TIG domain-containing protein